MAKKGKTAKTLFDKVKELDPTFIEEVYSQSGDALKDRVLALTREEQEIETAKQADSSIPAIKEELKAANETYSIPLKAIKMKRRLIMEILGEKGK